jgi:hypothetical protein
VRAKNRMGMKSGACYMHIHCSALPPLRKQILPLTYTSHSHSSLQQFSNVHKKRGDKKIKFEKKMLTKILRANNN